MRKKQDIDGLRTFQSTSLELVALGDAILFYLNWMRAHPKEVRPVHREVEKLLIRFHSRLVEQVQEGH